MEIIYCILSGLFTAAYFAGARHIIKHHDVGVDNRLVKRRNFTFWISLVVLVVIFAKIANLWQIGAFRACLMSYFIAYLLFQSFTDYYTHNLYTLFDMTAIAIGCVNFTYSVYHMRDTLLVYEMFTLLIALLVILFVAKKLNLFGAGDIDALIAMSLFMLPYGGAFGTASIIIAMIIGFSIYLISRVLDRIVRKIKMDEKVERPLIPMLAVGVLLMVVA